MYMGSGGLYSQSLCNCTCMPVGKGKLQDFVVIIRLIAVLCYLHDNGSICIATTTSVTHWGRHKFAAILQTTFSDALSWMKMYEFLLNNVLNQWWLDYRRMYASLGINELTTFTEWHPIASKMTHKCWFMYLSMLYHVGELNATKVYKTRWFISYNFLNLTFYLFLSYNRMT